MAAAATAFAATAPTVTAKSIKEDIYQRRIIKLHKPSRGFRLIVERLSTYTQYILTGENGLVLTIYIGDIEFVNESPRVSITVSFSFMSFDRHRAKISSLFDNKFVVDPLEIGSSFPVETFGPKEKEEIKRIFSNIVEAISLLD